MDRMLRFNYRLRPHVYAQSLVRVAQVHKGQDEANQMQIRVGYAEQGSVI